MFKFLKKFFEKEEEPTIEKIKFEELNRWLERQVADLGLTDYIKEYFKQLAWIKTQLLNRTKELLEEEIPKEHKNVEARVKNIVLGHRANYANLIRIFADKVKLPDQEFETIDDFQKLLAFNQELDHHLDQLAKQTAKNYQAAQHLFFNTVENIFKELQELNRQVKDFNKKLQEKGVHQLQSFQEAISNFSENRQKWETISKDLQEKQAKMPQLQQELEKAKHDLKKQEESADYRAYLEMIKRKEAVSKDLKIIEQEIFSYFSKLSKPLRRYERLATDHKLVKRYNEDFIKTFWEDHDLKIIASLAGMKKSLPDLRFDSKYQENFAQLADKAKELLNAWREKGKTLQERMAKIDESIHNSKVEEKMKKTKEMINHLSLKINSLQEQLPEMKENISNINLENNLQTISEKAKELFKKEIRITFSS